MDNRCSQIMDGWKKRGRWLRSLSALTELTSRVITRSASTHHKRYITIRNFWRFTATRTTANQLTLNACYVLKFACCKHNKLII